jgi:hypothetical protein
MKWEKTAYKTALDILKDEDYNMTDQEKEYLIRSMGLDMADVEYLEFAKETSDIKAVMIRETMSGYGSREEFLHSLTQLRREVVGDMVLNNATIDNLVDDGILSKEEGKAFKDLKIGKDGQAQVKMSGRGASAKLKKFSVSVPPRAKFVPVTAVSGDVGSGTASIGKRLRGLTSTSSSGDKVSQDLRAAEQRIKNIRV